MTIQNAAPALNIQNFIHLTDNQPTTTSLEVADAFGKRHSHVLRKIEMMECSDNFASAHFWVDAKKVETSNGASRGTKYYTLTKNGFMFLVMGFSGKKAAAIKEAYINAFDEMYKMIFDAKAERPTSNSQALPTQTLTPAQQRHVQERVAEIVHASQFGVTYQSIYSKIKTQFKVGTYKDIAEHQYSKVCEYLQCEPQGDVMAAPDIGPALLPSQDGRYLVVVKGGRISHAQNIEGKNLVNAGYVRALRENLNLVAKQIRILSGDASPSILDTSLVDV